LKGELFEEKFSGSFSLKVVLEERKLFEVIPLKQAFTVQLSTL
jgi:hypothetical protein